MALHLMGVVPTWRKGISDQHKRVMPYVCFGGSRLSQQDDLTGSQALGYRRVMTLEPWAKAQAERLILQPVRPEIRR